MSAKIHERRVFPSGDFDRLPMVGATANRRTYISARGLALLGAGMIIGAALELLPR